MISIPSSAEAMTSPRARNHWQRAFAEKAGDLLPLCDFAGVLLTAYLSSLVYLLWSTPTSVPLNLWRDFSALAWVAAAIAAFLLYERRFADLAIGGERAALVRSFAGRFLMLLGLVAAIAFAGHWLPRAPGGWLGLWLFGAVLAAAASRALLARHLRRLAQAGALAQRVAIVGAGAMAERVAALLRKDAALYGTFPDVDALLAHAPIDKPERILIVLATGAEARLQSMVEQLRSLEVPVELCPADAGGAGSARLTRHVGESLPVELLADRPIRRWNAVLKSLEDAVLGTLMLVMLLPVLAGIALLIKLDSRGPVLFKQRRHGINNREFDIYKFRTMRCAGEAAGSALKQTVRGDDRITRVGRVLRRFSLDELPQVFNVLQGNMSLVGPRPHAVNMRTEAQLGHEVIDVYPHRHRVKPGISGWSQVNGFRGATDTVAQLRGRVELDLHYVENWSLLLDLKILVMTCREVVRARNAY